MLGLTEVLMSLYTKHYDYVYFVIIIMEVLQFEE
jgi:hypothetical protein